MLGLVYLPPRTAARERVQSGQVRKATAHWAVFEPLGLRAEPFRGLGPLPRAPELVQEYLGQIRVQETLSPGSAIQKWDVVCLAWRLLLGA